MRQIAAVPLARLSGGKPWLQLDGGVRAHLVHSGAKGGCAPMLWWRGLGRTALAVCWCGCSSVAASLRDFRALRKPVGFWRMLGTLQSRNWEVRARIVSSGGRTSHDATDLTVPRVVQDCGPSLAGQVASRPRAGSGARVYDVAGATLGVQVLRECCTQHCSGTDVDVLVLKSWLLTFSAARSPLASTLNHRCVITNSWRLTGALRSHDNAHKQSFRGYCSSRRHRPVQVIVQSRFSTADCAI
jgi:hypothetical protein